MKTISDAALVELYWRTTGDDWAIPDEVMVKFGRAVLRLAAASPTPTGPEPATCCDMHNRNCEPPSELCCGDCSEQCHGMHDCPRGWTTGHHGNPSECIAPDLSGPGPASPEPTEETP